MNSVTASTFLNDFSLILWYKNIKSASIFIFKMVNLKQKLQHLFLNALKKTIKTNHSKNSILTIYFYKYHREKLYKFLRRSLMIFIIKDFLTIVFIFIVISTTFRPICPPAFFRCLLNSGTYTELRTTSFIESTGVACSDSVTDKNPLC